MSAVAMSVGHVAMMVVEFLDQNGNPMLTMPTPDATPTWSDVETPLGISSLVPATDGLSATESPSAAGVVVASVALSVGGNPFSVSQELDVSAVAQVLTSITIRTTVL